jgi:hypothetical protein
MRDLSPDERELLQRRRAEFGVFFAEMMPTLKDFLSQLGARESAYVVRDADRFLLIIEQWGSEISANSENRIFLITRLGYYIGELLVQRWSGCWFVNDIPDSRYFGRYVVGRFARLKNLGAMIDPFFVADSYVSMPPKRSLVGIVSEVEEELKNA